jgi:hypothetical protein
MHVGSFTKILIPNWSVKFIKKKKKKKEKQEKHDRHGFLLSRWMTGVHDEMCKSRKKEYTRG